MRRNPVAVYRIIDEEELLGGEDFELSSRPELAGRAARRALRRGRTGWGSTALGVLALACVAALLLMLSPRARPPLPATPTPPRASTPASPALTVTPAAMPARARPPHAVRSRTRRLIVRRERRAPAPGPAGTARGARPAVTVSRAGRSVTPPIRFAPDLEFGFER
jgi:hypothetical protein